MNTHTRSTHTSALPFDDPDRESDVHDPFQGLHDLKPGLGFVGRRLPASVSRGELMTVIDEFGDTPSGRRVLHQWDHHELLADALQLLVDQLRVDPLRLEARDLAAAFGTDLFRRLPEDPDDLSLLPEMIAAFVPYAHALRRLPTAETAASLAVIAQCRSGYLASVDRHLDRGYWDSTSRWDRCSLEPPSRWQPPPEPTVLERLTDEVGGADALEALTVEPLPDETLDLSEVVEDIRDRLQAAMDYADPVTERVFGPEIRTAMRRLLVDSAVLDPAIFRRKGRIDTLGAGACLAVAQANHLLGPRGSMPAKDFAKHFDLSSSPARRADTLRYAVTGGRRWSPGTSLRSPRYLTSTRRAQIIAARRRLGHLEIADRAS